MVRIAFDLDDVLGDHTEKFVLFYNQEYGRKKGKRLIDIEEVGDYNFAPLLSVSDEECYGILARFYDSEFFEAISPKEGAQRSVEKILNLGHASCVITSRPKPLAAKTRAWIKRYFEGIDPKQVLLSKEIFPGPESLKGPICKQRRIDIIVEDSLEQAISCSHQCAVLLFDRPWNRRSRVSLPTHVKRVYTWDDVFNEVDKY